MYNFDIQIDEETELMWLNYKYKKDQMSVSLRSTFLHQIFVNKLDTLQKEKNNEERMETLIYELRG